MRRRTSDGRYIVRHDGSVDIRRIGLRSHPARDLYHAMRAASWATLIACIAVAYVSVNVAFGYLYMLQPGAVLGADPDNFWDYFFFSVETLSTVGYGSLAPATTYAHAIVTLESLVGLLMTAVTTGIAFSKFSTPAPRVLFSRVAVISRESGTPTLMFRMANRRASHMIVEAQIRVTLVRDERMPDGSVDRRLKDLTMRRSTSPLFAISWTAYHDIDEESPLHGLDANTLVRDHAAFVVTLTGIDDSLSTAVHTRHAYHAGDIHFGRHFKSVLRELDDGSRYVDYRVFHDTVADA